MIKKTSLEAGQQRFGFLLTVPALLAFLLLILGPFLRSAWLAFHEYLLTSTEPRFIGFGNFTKLFADSAFLVSWQVTAVFVVCTTVVTTLLGTAYALLLNEPMRGRSIVRAASPALGTAEHRDRTVVELDIQRPIRHHQRSLFSLGIIDRLDLLCPTMSGR